MFDKVALGLEVDVAAADGGDVLALDGDIAVLLQPDAGIARPDGHGLTGVDHDVGGDRQMIILANRRAPAAGHVMRLAAADIDRAVQAHIGHLLQPDGGDLRRAHGDSLSGTDVHLLRRTDIDQLVDAHIVGAQQGDTCDLVAAHGNSPVGRDGDGLIRSDGLGAIGADLDFLVGAHALGAIDTDSNRLGVADRLGAIVADLGVLVMGDGLGPVVPYRVGLVVLDHTVLVLLGVDVELLRALQVLEADLVEVGFAAALAAAALDAALGEIAPR